MRIGPHVIFWVVFMGGPFSVLAQPRSVGGSGHMDGSLAVESVELLLLSNPERALETARTGLEQAKKGGEEKTIAEWQLVLGKSLYKVGDNRSALSVLEQCLNWFRQNRYVIHEAETLNVVGIVERLTGSFQKALVHHNLAYTIYEAKEDKGGLAYSLNLMGVAYRNLGDLEEAESSYFRALDIVPESENRTRAAIFISIGSLAWYQGDSSRALEFYQKAFDLYEAKLTKDDSYIGIVNNIGNTYRQMGDLNRAIAYYSNALGLAQKRNDKNLICVINKNLGMSYLAIEDLSRAESQFKETLALLEETAMHRVRLECLDGLVQTYRQLNRYEEAFQALDQYVALYKKQINEQTTNRLSNLKAEHEIQLQEKRLQLLETQRDEVRLLYLVVFLVLLSLAIIAWLSRFRFKAQAHEAIFQKDHEIQETRSQIDRLKEEFDQIEDRFQRFFHSAPDAIIVFEHQSGVILNANSRAHHLFGSGVSSLVGQILYDYFAGRFKADVLGLAGSQTEHLLRNHETELNIPGKEPVPVEISLHDLKFEGKEVYQVIVRDLTKRKKLENQLIQSQKMEAVGSLAGGIAHDFNNLLTVIRGYCEVIKLAGSAKLGFDSQLGEIDKAAERAQTLTQQLLAFSRKQVQRKRVFSLNELINDMLSMLKPLIGETIQVITRLKSELPHVYADRSQIEQVILNLAVNAKDAMPEGGVLTLVTEYRNLVDERIHTDVSIIGSYVQLTVQDSGVGMDEVTQSQIFEPFFSTKKERKGTGLGLSMVYGIIKQHQGFIRVQSRLGKGTEFDVFLKPHQMDHATDEPLRSQTFPEDAFDNTLSGEETILVVEDDERLRAMLVQILEARKYRVVEATGGEEGLKVCKSLGRSIDLILTDMVMPGMSGKEMVNALGSDFPTNRVIYMSGYSEQVMKYKEIEEQGSHLMEKPFRLTELLKLIRRLLEQK